MLFIGFMVIPAVSTYLLNVLAVLLNPEYFASENAAIRLWVFLLLPSFAITVRVASKYDKFKGQWWTGFADVVAVLLFLPCLLGFYLVVLLLLIVIAVGGSYMAWQ